MHKRLNKRTKEVVGSPDNLIGQTEFITENLTGGMPRKLNDAYLLADIVQYDRILIIKYRFHHQNMYDNTTSSFF